MDNKAKLRAALAVAQGAGLDAVTIEAMTEALIATLTKDLPPGERLALNQSQLAQEVQDAVVGFVDTWQTGITDNIKERARKRLGELSDDQWNKLVQEANGDSEQTPPL